MLLISWLKDINFIKYENGKPSNVGTVHTFQGKENKVVFLVLGASDKEKGAANWAVSEPNIINVAATRAKVWFFIIGDKKLYQSIGSETITKTIKAIDDYNRKIDSKSNWLVMSEFCINWDWYLFTKGWKRNYL